MTRTMPTAPAPTADLHGALNDALAASRAARVEAERKLHRSENRRRHAAAALEVDLRPMRIDEAARARLRDEYTLAASEVTARRTELERARALESAAATVVAALADADSPLGRQAATSIAQVLSFRQHGGTRDAATRGRVGRGSVLPVRRAVRRRDTPPRSA
jgi:acetyl-CoA carboxylase alpha subunit